MHICRWRNIRVFCLSERRCGCLYLLDKCRLCCSCPNTFSRTTYMSVSSVLFPAIIIFGERISRAIFTAVPRLEPHLQNILLLHEVIIGHYKSGSYAIYRREFLLYFTTSRRYIRRIVIQSVGCHNCWYDRHALHGERLYRW